ncbi:MAG: antibiotic biosynthesis monooxygenase [Actinomycetota bacterium]|nr:antibiotic biosynthesis monooxygenase [Actinomycetota bacterium]
MKVLRAESEDEVLVITRWRNREAFNAWVGSEEFCTPSVLALPRLTVTAMK